MDVDSMCLADSGGMLLSVDNRSGWTLASFYENNNLQPSRYKLYVVVGQENAGKEVTVTYNFIIVTDIPIQGTRRNGHFKHNGEGALGNSCASHSLCHLFL